MQTSDAFFAVLISPGQAEQAEGPMSNGSNPPIQTTWKLYTFDTVDSVVLKKLVAGLPSTLLMQHVYTSFRKFTQTVVFATDPQIQTADTQGVLMAT